MQCIPRGGHSSWKLALEALIQLQRLVLNITLLTLDLTRTVLFRNCKATVNMSAKAKF